MRTLVIALCLIGVPAAAWQEPAVDADEPDPQPYASISAKARLGGDVEIAVFLHHASHDLDLNGRVRQALSCDWQPSHTTSYYVSGVCRRLLKASRGRVEDRLILAPLVATLFQSGAARVDLTLTAKGESEPAPGPSWQNDGKVKISGSTPRFWHFRAVAGESTPPPFQVRLGTGWKPDRLAAPLLFVIFGPTLLAVWVRRQMVRKKSAPGSGAVWLNWLLLGSWLYWISAMHIEDIGGFAAALSFDSPLASLLIGATVYAVPPLLATVMCLLALAPQAQPGTPSSGQLGRFIRQTIASEATFIVPLGLFLVGTTLMEEEWRVGMLSMVAAYAAWRLLAWCSWRWTSQHMVPLHRGELKDRTLAIAAAAGVNVTSVSLQENRYPMEANAFAMTGGRISFTRGLLENMPRREVDAVIAHEVGHLRGKHIGMRTGLFVAYLVIIGPAIGSLLTKTGAPDWAMTLPLAPLLYVLMAGQLSQRNELNADSRAVELTNDPEGTIAALARLARLTQSPVDWGGIQGSILSHPSMKRRVLSVAQRFGVPGPRALQLLTDPDALDGDALSAESYRYDLPEPAGQNAPVFSATAKLSHAYWTPWVFGAALIALLMSAAWLAVVISPENPLWDILIFLLSLPLVAWLALKVDDCWDCWFVRRIKRRIEANPGAPHDGLFVTLLPGDRVLHFEALCAWDLGRLSLSAGHLTYRGERTQFSVPRSDLTAIEIRKGPLGWCRTYAVVVRTSQTAFSLRLADRGRTERLARSLLEVLNAWRANDSEPAATTSVETLAPPDLPVVQPAIPSRLRIAWVFGIRTVLLFLGTIFLLSASPLMDRSPMFAFVPFTAPLVYLVVVCPSILRPQS